MKRLFILVFLCSIVQSMVAQNAADSAVFKAFLEYADRKDLAKLPAGERMVSVGQFFLGTPYVGGTLEADGPEQLRINLRELDCTTLVENVLALSAVLEESNPGWDSYRKQLTRIRYRQGLLDGYVSRLHYASDWLTDNVAKGFLSFPEVGAEGDTLRPSVFYMSTHPDLYAALKAFPEWIPVMAAHEKRIDGMGFRWLPKNKLTPKGRGICSGDIIAIATNVPGLDFAHLGIAVRKQGKLFLLHASSTGKKVMMTPMPLSDYLAGIKKHTGIVVARPIFSSKK